MHKTPGSEARAPSANSLSGQANQVRTVAIWLEDLQETAVSVRGRYHVTGRRYSYQTEVVLKYLLVI